MQRSIPFLWALVIILLVFILALVYSLNQIRWVAIDTLVKVETTLDHLANHEIVFDVEINQPVPLQAEIPINQTVDISLNTELDSPTNLVVPIELNETIKLDTVVQLNTTIPVKIKLGQTSLVNYINQANLYLSQLRSYLILGDGNAESLAFVDTRRVDQDIEPIHLIISSSPTVMVQSIVSTNNPAAQSPPVFVTATPQEISLDVTPVVDTQAVVRPIIEPVEPTPVPIHPPTKQPNDNTATATPVPTATPIPTSTNPPPVQPTSDVDEKRAALLAYAESISKLGDQIVLAGEEFKKVILAYAVGNISQIELQEEFWIFEPKVREPINEIVQIPPPPEAVDVHQKLTSGLDQCSQAMDLMKAWFDTGQGDSKEVTALLVFSCMSQVEEAERELQLLINK